MRTLFYGLLAGCLTLQATSQELAALSGRVVDRSNRYPIPGVNVVLEGTHLGACANAEGYYEVKSIPPDRYVIVVSIPGYAPQETEVRFAGGENKVMVFELDEMPYQLNPVTTTATRERSLVSEVPSSVDVIPLRELERRNIQDIGQAIEDLPGVFTKDYGSFGDLKTVSLRGSTSSQVLILVDGQRLNNAQSGDVDLNAIPIEGVERIEVVRGGASALYGADAIGGVINIITKSKPFQTSTGASASLLAGSFGTRGVEMGGNISTGRLYSVVSYKYLRTLGDFAYRTELGKEISRSNADLQSHGLFAKGVWTFGEEGMERSLSASGQYFFSRAGVPGTVEIPKTVARKENQNQSFNLVYEQKVGTPYNNFRIQSYFHDLKFRYDDPNAYVPEHADNRNRAWGAEIQTRMVLAVWNVVTAGYAYRGDDFSGSAGLGTQRRSLHSLYVQDELSPLLAAGSFPRRIVAIPAVRWDHFSDFGGRVSPKIGLVLSAGESWQGSLKVNIGSSFRAPSFNDLYWPKDAYSEGNPNLQPEQGTDFDVGVMVRHPAWGGIGTDVTYFRNRINELILWQPNASNIWTPLNVGKADIQGVEAKVSWTPWSDLLSLNWNYTYLDARNKTEKLNEFDMQLPYRARHAHNVSARIDLSGVYGQVSSSYLGKRFTTTSNTKELPGHRVTNLLLGMSRSLTPFTVDLSIEIRNLEDAEFQVMEGFPMPGREFRLSLQCKFLSITEANQSQEEHMGKP